MRLFFLIKITFLQLFFLNCYAFDTIYTKTDSNLIYQIEKLHQKSINFDLVENIKSRDSVIYIAYQMCQKINHHEYEAIFEHQLSNIKFHEESNNIEALQYALKAINNYKKCKNKKFYPQIIDLYVSIIDINNASLNFEDRKKFIDSVQTYLSKIDNVREKFVALITIDRVFISLNSPFLSNKYLTELDEISKLVRDSVLNLLRLRMHEDYLLSKNMFKEALSYNDSTIIQSSKIPDNSFIMFDYNRRANLYKKLNNISSSITYFNKSYQLALSLKHCKFQVINLTEMSKCMLNSNNIQLSSKYIKIAYELSKVKNYPLDLMKCHLIMYKIDSVNNNNLSALQNLKMYSLLRDSLYPIEKYKLINVTSYVDLAKIKNYNETLEYENQQKDKLLKSELLLTKFLWIITFFALIFGLLMLFFYFSYKRQTKMLILQKNHISDKNIELKEKNDNLEKLYQEKNDLISIVSHDLKAPLNRAKALSDLIMFTSENFTEEQKMLFGKLTKELADEKLLITEIFNSELLEVEISNIDLENVEINALLINFVESNKAAAQTKNIKVELVPYRENLIVYANEAYLKRVIDNLVSNSIKFSNRGTKIVILVDAFDNEVYVHIKDEGLGFTEADQLDLFKKYHKLSSKPTEGESSTGLGLSIVKRLVEVMQGNISLVSKKGVGSTFSLSFKRVKS